MPAAAVIRRAQALSEITGRKAITGGLTGLVLKPSAQPGNRAGNQQTRGMQRQVEFLL